MKIMNKGTWISIAFLCLFAAACTVCAGCFTADRYQQTEEESSVRFPEFVYDQEKGGYTPVTRKLALGSGGYYYIVNQILYYYDIDRNVAAPVCSDVNCTHNSKSCGAYMKYKEGIAITVEAGEVYNCVGNMVFCYNNMLYLIESTVEGDYLIQYDARLNNKESLCKLSEKCRLGSIDGTDYCAVVSSGYLYYLCAERSVTGYYKDNKADLEFNRVKLEKGAAPEQLGIIDVPADVGWGVSGSNVTVSGGNIYVLTSTATEIPREDGVQYRVCRYDVSEGKFERLFTHDSEETLHVFGTKTEAEVNFGASTFVDPEGNIYTVEALPVKFNPETGYYDAVRDYEILRLSAKTFEAEVIYRYRSEGTQMHYDGTDIYFVEDKAEAGGYHRITKISTSGEYLGSCELVYDVDFVSAENAVTDVTWRGGENETYAISLEEVLMNISLYGGDERYLMIGVGGYGVKGFHNDTPQYHMGMDPRGRKDMSAYGVCVIDKREFGKPDCELKTVYLWEK